MSDRKEQSAETPSIRSVRQFSYRNKVGQLRAGLLIKWDDGLRTRHLSRKSLPEPIRIKLAAFEEPFRIASPEGSRSSTTIRRVMSHGRGRLKRTGGSRWDVCWTRVENRLTVCWPTLWFASPLGFLGLAFTGFILVGMLSDQLDPDKWTRWLIIVPIISVLLLVAARLFRMTFMINRNQVSRSRWPGAVRPREAAPFDQVMGVMVKLFVMRGRTSRRMGTVQVRVRRPDGIDWWPLGGIISAHDACSLGQQLGCFVEVRTETSSDW